MGQIMRNGMKKEQSESLHVFSTPPLSVWATFGLQKPLNHFPVPNFLLENMPEYGTTQISLLPKCQIDGPTVKNFFFVIYHGSFRESSLNY